MNRIGLRYPLLGALLVSLAALPAVAQDPAAVASEHFKVTIDNPSVRVLDIRLAAGAKMPMHSHPAYITVALTPCKVLFTAADGKTAEGEVKAGEVRWREAESHAVENIGGAECHVLNIELKQAAGAGGP